MTIYLKQSTASQEVPLGYFLDSTDGNTEETGLTIANTDIKIWKAGATTLANKNSGGATHISNGMYYAVLDATDTDTLGPLTIHVHVSGALAVKQECFVMTSAAYDIMTGTTANTPANVTQFNGTNGTFASGRPEVNTSHLAGSSLTADGPIPLLGIVDQGTAQSATSTTLVVRAAAAFANDSIIGCVVAAYGSDQGYWQFREITDVVLSTDTLTVDAWTVTPTGTITYRVFLGAPAPASVSDGSGLTNIPWNASWDAQVQSEVQDAIEANHLDHLLAVTYDPASKPGAADALLNELVESDSGVSRFTTNALEQAPSGTGASASAIADEVQTRTIAAVTVVNGLAANVITAAATAADFTTEIQNGLATAASLATLDGKVDTIDGIVDAILADTGTDGVLLATGSVSAAALATDAVNEIADGILDRNMGTGTDSGSTTVRTPRQALRVLRNRVAVSGGTATVYKEDDSTSSWTAAVTTTAGDPISEVNPAGGS